jgi:centrosomal protein CEP290
LQQLRNCQKTLEEKDELCARLSRQLDDYESNVYGLHNAVVEIKDLKSKLTARDAEITTLTSRITALTKDLDLISEENEAIRVRFGLGPGSAVSVEPLRAQRDAELASLKAQNQVLVREVDQLEIERLELRKQLIKANTVRVEAEVAGGSTAGLSLNRTHLL